MELNFYKLVQFFQDYINPERVEISIKIRSYITWSWLNQLGYKYKDIYKDIFIDGYKWLDMIGDYTKFFKVIKDLKSYIIEFKKD